MIQSPVPNLWQPYGLQSSPFFQNELRAGDPTHPVSLFVGREEESARVQRRVMSDPATRTIVQGAPGVGKSSFVNWIKSRLTAQGVATYEHPIRIHADTTRISFVADTLRTLARIRAASGVANKNATFWKQTARLLEGGALTGGSASALGVGAGITRSYVAPQTPQDSLYEHLGEAIQNLTAELAAPVLLHVNNLENLQDTTAAAVLIKDLRDYFMLAGAHWIFVGALGIEDDVFRVYTQVSGIFPAAETLEPLAPNEIQRLLERRYEHLQIKGHKYIAPVEPSVAAEIYTLYQGDLRNFLRLLGDASERALGLHGPQPMSTAALLRSVQAEYAVLLRRQIGDNDFDALGTIVDSHQGADPEFRVTEAAQVLKVSQSAASQLIERLLRQRVLHKTRVEGRSTYYRPIGAVLVATGVDPRSLRQRATTQRRKPIKK